MIITEDYKSYYKDNSELINLLEKNSILYDKLKDVIYVLNYISDFFKANKENSKNEDLMIILETGFPYFHELVEQIKIYYEKYFNKDLILLKKYEVLINFILYVEDYIEVLIEKEYYNDKRKEILTSIIDEIEKILAKRLEWTENDLSRFNVLLESCVPDNVDLLTTDNIFAQIAEELLILG